jgi:NTE family protein
MKTDLELIKKEIGDEKLGNDPLSVSERLNKLSNKRFSDVISKDEKGRILQWVNFVQEGGGTLGISLVGYAFVLEYVGIRFLRIAGTSAGAINTLFLAAMGNKGQPKSAELYDMMMDEKRFDLRSFVDAKLGIVRFLIFSFSAGSGLFRNLIRLYFFIALLALLVTPFLMMTELVTKGIYLFFLVFFTAVTLLIAVLFQRFCKYRYGINPGKSFEEFLDRELEKSEVANLNDLKAKASGYFQLNDEIFFSTKEDQVQSIDNLSSGVNAPPNQNWHSGIYEKIDGVTHNETLPGLYLIRDKETKDFKALSDKDKSVQKESIEKIRFDYSFVTTDIANQCKVVLPQDENLYQFDSQKDSPALFVRSSMAIPLFFEPKIFQVNRNGGWLETKGFNNLSTQSIFIDGGSLSNFPINLFHNEHITEARVPILGARIQDEKPVENKKAPLTFLSYLGSIINTLRNNEDSSFLAVNPFYKKFSIAEINTYNTKINWLNFALTKHEKKKLFLTGVEAALFFLEQFNWELYKEERRKTL